MSKHAYMIMAHEEFTLLEKLLVALDDERNDIYLHVDSKVKDFDPARFACLVKNATFTCVKRISTVWGGFSLAQAELELLKEATKTQHSYYHLLSGVDIPLKSQSYIHQFFEEHAGQQFIGFDRVANETGNFVDRYRYCHFLQEKIGRDKDWKSNCLRTVERISLRLQKLLGVNYNKKTNLKFYKGENWFSITHDLACYLVEHEAQIQKVFRYGYCPDEIFLQTFAMASPFRDKIAGRSMRYMDWKRGRPYTFRAEDYDLLIGSDRLFARKFSYTLDSEIVDSLHEHNAQ